MEIKKKKRLWKSEWCVNAACAKRCFRNFTSVLLCFPPRDASLQRNTTRVRNKRTAGYAAVYTASVRNMDTCSDHYVRYSVKKQTHGLLSWFDLGLVGSHGQHRQNGQQMLSTFGETPTRHSRSLLTKLIERTSVCKAVIKAQCGYFKEDKISNILVRLTLCFIVLNPGHMHAATLDGTNKRL